MNDVALTNGLLIAIIVFMFLDRWFPREDT